MKRNVYLVQVNNEYGRNVFLPYSVGLLQSYAQTRQVIRDNYEFKDFVFLREPVDEVASRMESPDVVGISCYIWNWEYSLAMARAVKRAHPSAIVVLGGPHVPVDPANWTGTDVCADLLVYYEGEVTFAEILEERLKPDADYTGIQGLGICTDNKISVNPFRTRLSNLEEIPSPYLAGLFDEMVKDERYDFHVSQETHRGCPYACTFCDWGSNLVAKVKQFTDKRVLDEIRWCGDHKIDLLYNCDANYGLFKRDLDLTHEMVKIKSEFGFPRKFRAAYAKNSNDMICKIAKALNDAGMNKGITLSFQSMDDKTLEIVKRKNIKVTDFERLMDWYKSEKIATYSEIIIGLPGETYDTFADGISLMLDCGQHDSIQVYTCEVLPNSEMNAPAYKEKHGIKTVKSPVPMFHGTASKDPHQEYYELIVQTNTMPSSDWLRAQMFSWIVQALHCLGLTQVIAIMYRRCTGKTYREFYEALIKYFTGSKTLIGELVRSAGETFWNLENGLSWGAVDERFGNITWPPEEIAFLRAVSEKDKFYEEIQRFLDYHLDDEWWWTFNHILAYQKALVMDPYQQEKVVVGVGSDVHKAFEQKSVLFHVKKVTYMIKPERVFNGDLETYAREVVWYGRKGGTFLHRNVGVA